MPQQDLHHREVAALDRAKQRGALPPLAAGRQLHRLQPVNFCPMCQQHLHDCSRAPARRATEWSLLHGAIDVPALMLHASGGQTLGQEQGHNTREPALDRQVERARLHRPSHLLPLRAAPLQQRLALPREAFREEVHGPHPPSLRKQGAQSRHRRDCAATAAAAVAYEAGGPSGKEILLQRPVREAQPRCLLAGEAAAEQQRQAACAGGLG
mmetsp:Transcript_52023/g.147410  ORF Transcript_52023/g.147410 Transcript_52023/m.147410 type:complete len:211 (+) Transcript_52023:325-957(+)